MVTVIICSSKMHVFSLTHYHALITTKHFLYKPAHLALDVKRMSAIFSLNYKSSYPSSNAHSNNASRTSDYLHCWCSAVYDDCPAWISTCFRWKPHCWNGTNREWVHCISFLPCNMLWLISHFFSDCVAPGLRCLDSFQCCYENGCFFQGEPYGICLPGIN